MLWKTLIDLQPRLTLIIISLGYTKAVTARSLVVKTIMTEKFVEKDSAFAIVSTPAQLGQLSGSFIFLAFNPV